MMRALIQHFNWLKFVVREPIEEKNLITSQKLRNLVDAGDADEFGMMNFNEKYTGKCESSAISAEGNILLPVDNLWIQKYLPSH